MSEERRVKVTFEGRDIGWAKVSEDNYVAEIEVNSEDMKHIIPGGDVTEGLSIAFQESKVPVSIVDDQILADYSEAYYRNRPKGTFDA